MKKNYNKKTKIMKISFDGLHANSLHEFIAKLAQLRFLMSESFERSKSYQNLTTNSGSRPRFSLL